VRLSNMFIREAVARGASDIHLETYERHVRVRFRIDGTLYEVAHPPWDLRESVISRFKVLAGMNIAENRVPQDGRFKMRLRSGERTKTIDVRASAIPTIWGEKVALRILDPDRLMLDLAQLGFERDTLERFQGAIAKPYGMVLVVGPSGCGKTNTLYSALTAINRPEVNIITAEDPVEFNIKGVNQVQTDEGIGYSFATALRHLLRQDPNIILVGEIRDYETAEIAVKAALTGHLVLSTLHTSDATTTVSRLVNMGVEPYLIATSVLMISAQRLVRRNCTECSEPDPRPDSELLDLGFRPEDLPVVPRKGAGCRKCHQRGTRGRTALFEVLEFTDAVRELIMAGAGPLELKLQARQDGMITMRQGGLHKVREGITCVDEVTRETIL
jgi:type IV pilus assembly protein PilB